MASETISLVTVEWLRSTTDAAGEHGCNIGPRHYEGRRGEQVEMRSDDAEILAAGGYVRRVLAEQVEPTPAAGFTRPDAGQP